MEVFSLSFVGDLSLYSPCLLCYSHIKNHMTRRSPLLQALSDHHVHASVVDMDHYRKLGFVRTDYIIFVHPDEKAEDSFESFK